MRIRNIVALPFCLLACAAVAQTMPAPDQWTPLAPASVAVSGNVYAAHAGTVPAPPSPFKFKEPRQTWEREPPPPRANDEQTVMGVAHPWMNGQPPVVCAQTPHDPACR